MIRNHFAIAVLAVFAAVTGCPETPEGEGELTVVAYGEELIEEGIPEDAVDDGWAIEFSSFEVALEAISLAGESFDAPATVDLTEPSMGEGQFLDKKAVLEGEHSDASFVLRSVELTGTATKDSEQKTFHWLLDAATDFRECETTTKVSDGGEATFQITIHADHLFYDSLVAEEPALRFQPLADADTDDDGEITEAELAATDIGDYDPGSEGDIEDLWAFLLAQARTLGHVDGEGHCHAEPAE